MIETFSLQMLDVLQNLLLKEPQEPYPAHSRVHSLKTCSSSSCFVKREDELGFGISGSKVRKYLTLIPYLYRQGCQEVVVIGGAFSNHVVGISQLLIEKGIQPTLFLKGPAPASIQGNYFFLRMLVKEENIRWISKEQWREVNEIASGYAVKSGAFVLPEAGRLFPAFLGALSLPLDILRNEEEQHLSFDHVFIDVGTGWTAAALLLGFAFLEKKTKCHLLLLAEDEKSFLRTLQELHLHFEKWLGRSCPFPKNFMCHTPQRNKSFGSTNSELFQFITRFAQEEGFFLDPIYSGKLFHFAQDYIKRKELKGNILLIHSGGALSLSGFHEQFQKVLKEKK